MLLFRYFLRFQMCYYVIRKFRQGIPSNSMIEDSPFDCSLFFIAVTPQRSFFSIDNNINNNNDNDNNIDINIDINIVINNNNITDFIPCEGQGS